MFGNFAYAQLIWHLTSFRQTVQKAPSLQQNLPIWDTRPHTPSPRPLFASPGAPTFGSYISFLRKRTLTENTIQWQPGWPAESRSRRRRRGNHVRVHRAQVDDMAVPAERILHAGTGRLVGEPRRCHEAWNSTAGQTAASRSSVPPQ